VAWTTPITWSANQLVSAATLNAQLRDNMLLLATSIDTSNGKITAISSAYFDSLDGSNLTNVGILNAVNTWTAKNDFSGGRLVIPVGANLWGT